VSVQPPAPGTPPIPAPGSLRCPRCSATIGPEQDWCLECGAPARTRLAQTPNWQLPTVAIAAIVLVAGAMLAFAFVKLTDDGNAPASTTQAPVSTAVPVVPPAPTTVVPPAATTPTTPTTTPTAPATTPRPSTTTPATPPGPATTPATTPPPRTVTTPPITTQRTTPGP
jgi:hypothetical protein